MLNERVQGQNLVVHFIEFTVFARFNLFNLHMMLVYNATKNTFFSNKRKRTHMVLSH